MEAKVLTVKPAAQFHTSVAVPTNACSSTTGGYSPMIEEAGGETELYLKGTLGIVLYVARHSSLERLTLLGRTYINSPCEQRRRSHFPASLLGTIEPP